MLFYNLNPSCGGLPLASLQTANEHRRVYRRAKMSKEIVLTMMIPLWIVGATGLAIVVISKSKQRRIKRGLEQGIADYLAIV